LEIITLDTDVIIVGGGPSGSTAARYLAQQGLSTILLEKSKFPRRKICAAGLLQHTFRVFPETEPFLDTYNYAVKIVSPNLRTQIDIEESEPLLAMTRGRADFDNQLMQLAIKAGAEVQFEQQVKEIEYASNAVHVKTKEGKEYSGKIIIGADSANSIVAKSQQIGINHQIPHAMGLAIEKEYALSEKIMDEYFSKARKVSLYLSYKGTIGYCWLFPRKTSLNIGIGGEIHEGRILTDRFHDFMCFIKQLGIIPSDLSSEKPDAALLPSTYPDKTTAARTLLVGDAAGFCSAATGEGIYYALMSGKIAAEAAAKIIKLQDFSAKSMLLYEQMWKKEIGEELKFQYYARHQVLADIRRCHKAVRWASQDAQLRHLFAGFLTGSVSYHHLAPKMLYHYARCKALEKLGKI
jgi:geranylgeranyl reductase family protein